MFSKLDLKEMLKKKKEKEEDEQRKRLEVRNRKVNNSESKQNPNTSQAQNSREAENNDDKFLNTHKNNVSPISPTYQNISRYNRPLKDRTFKRCVCTGVIALIILLCIGIALGILVGSGGKLEVKISKIIRF
jgi:sugar-specific transcriptional regulator TrmB